MSGNSACRKANCDIEGCGYSAASISSMSFFSSALTSSFNDTAARRGAGGQEGQHLGIEMHRRRQDGVWAIEPAAFGFREIVFVLHVMVLICTHGIGFSRYCRASLAVGRRAEMMRTALVSGSVSTQVCTTTRRFPVLVSRRGDPAFLAGAGIAVQDRPDQRVAKHRHCLLEGDAVFGGIARRLGRVPVEVDAHGSQLAAEGATLERGEKGVELCEVGVVVVL